MVMQYAHLGESDLSEWASDTGAGFSNQGRFKAQSEDFKSSK